MGLRPHLDPQLQWAGKAEHTRFQVPTVSLHVHERIDPKTILSAVRRRATAPAARQIFFPMAGEAEGWARLARGLRAEIDLERIDADRGTASLPFEAEPRQKVAVKVVDDRGTESLRIVPAVVRDRDRALQWHAPQWHRLRSVAPGTAAAQRKQHADVPGDDHGLKPHRDGGADPVRLRTQAHPDPRALRPRAAAPHRLPGPRAGRGARGGGEPLGGGRARGEGEPRVTGISHVTNVSGRADEQSNMPPYVSLLCIMKL